MQFEVAVKTPTGVELTAWVDEWNVWETPGYPGRRLSDFLSLIARTQLEDAPYPSHLDPRPAYAYAIQDAWPGSAVRTRLPAIKGLPRSTGHPRHPRW